MKCIQYRWEKTYNDVVNDENDEHFVMVHVQWWVLLKKGGHNVM
jgi:hypothetical protein